MHRKPFLHQRPKSLERRMAHRPQWFSTFLAGNHREQNRLRREIATMKGSVVWLLRQRRQGQWSLDERTRLREVMRSASAVSPYLIIWAIPGSLLYLYVERHVPDVALALRWQAALVGGGWLVALLRPVV